MRDLQELPKVADSLSYLYVEHCRVDKQLKAIAIHASLATGPVRAANLLLMMLGPGTTITHAAIRTLAEDGCLVAWCGEEAVRFYAQGLGETRSASRLIHQAQLVSNPATRLEVARRMYFKRFEDPVAEEWTIQQLRGHEGVRVRSAYARASQETGVEWQGRKYDRQNWGASDQVNRALSTANAALYGVCHAAIVSAGYSPGLGFIHTGKLLSFVYDIADLYKTEITIPLAFQVVSEGTHEVARRVRLALRDYFHDTRLLKRIVPDIHEVLDVDPLVFVAPPVEDRYDVDGTTPGTLWDPTRGTVAGGVNFAEELDQADLSAKFHVKFADNPEREYSSQEADEISHKSRNLKLEFSEREIPVRGDLEPQMGDTSVKSHRTAPREELKNAEAGKDEDDTLDDLWEDM